MRRVSGEARTPGSRSAERSFSRKPVLWSERSVRRLAALFAAFTQVRLWLLVAWLPLDLDPPPQRIRSPLGCMRDSLTAGIVSSPC
jgi:hypothetical protein